MYGKAVRSGVISIRIQYNIGLYELYGVRNELMCVHNMGRCVYTRLMGRCCMCVG